MAKDDATHRLGQALNHLHAFASTFSAGDYVDEESALTSEDLGYILDVLEKIHAIAKTASKL
jgi:hypothetical protein